jgi:hypothetical protein
VSELKNATLKVEMTECMAAITEAAKEMSDNSAKVTTSAAAAKAAEIDLSAANDAMAVSQKKLRTAVDAANAALTKAA